MAEIAFPLCKQKVVSGIRHSTFFFFPKNAFYGSACRFDCFFTVRAFISKKMWYIIFSTKIKRIKNIEETLLCWKIETTN